MHSCLAFLRSLRWFHKTFAIKFPIVSAALSIISGMEGDNRTRIRALTSAGVFGFSQMCVFLLIEKFLLFHMLAASVEHLYSVKHPENGHDKCAFSTNFFTQAASVLTNNTTCIIV